jgi:hypothetical protein
MTQHSPHLQPGASLKLNLCSDVPDSEIPEICRSLIKTVGYKMYFIGERQVTPTLCALCAPPSPSSPSLTLVQVCSDLGFQQFGHWSLIDNGNPDVGVRCSRCPTLSAAPPTHSLRVEYGFGPQYSSAVRQSVSDCELVARGAGLTLLRAVALRHLLRLQLGRRLPGSDDLPVSSSLPHPYNPLYLQLEVVGAPKRAHRCAALVRASPRPLRYSAHGCPYKCTGWQYIFVFLFFVCAIGMGPPVKLPHVRAQAAAAYFGGGFLYNVKRLGMPLEKESLPHYMFWTQLLPELVKEVLAPRRAPLPVHAALIALQGVTYTILTARGLAAVPWRGAYEQL